MNLGVGGGFAKKHRHVWNSVAIRFNILNTLQHLLCCWSVSLATRYLRLFTAN